MTLNGSTAAANSTDPTDKLLGTARSNAYVQSTPTAKLASDAISNQASIGNTGGNQSVTTQSPALAMRYCVVLQGLYPSRN